MWKSKVFRREFLESVFILKLIILIGLTATYVWPDHAIWVSTIANVLWLFKT